jgi:high-affinity nickel-transport protein
MALFAGLIVVNILAWFWAWTLFSEAPPVFGAAVLAYTFGVRHAVDADHIAAIDNVIRKLMQPGGQERGREGARQRRRLHTVGFYFALGHSSVVFLAVAATVSAGVALNHEFVAFKPMLAVIGAGVSAFFLLAIGVANLFILNSTWRTFSAMRSEKSQGAIHAHAHVGAFGPLTRLLRPLFRAITRPWHMCFLGFLFGLGFDTATEISLLSLSASQAADTVSMTSLFVFPALFTAGMALVDTADSALMVGAYDWAFINPVRKLWYNLTITASSAAIAIFIGGVEAISLIASKLGLEGWAWSAIAQLNKNLANTGFVVIGIFLASWAISAAIYRWKRFDQFAPPEILPPFEASACRISGG